MKQVIKNLVLLLALAVILTSRAPREAPSTKSADNAAPGIEAVMRSIKDQDFETLAAFDSNGQLLFQTTSHEKGSVSVTSAQLNQFWSEDGAVIMHNHPSGSTFSPTDLLAEAQRGTRRAIVVTDKDIYILEPGTRGWGDAERLYDAYVTYTEYFTREAETRKELVSARATVIWVQDQALTATAADFGLHYWSMPMKQVFCFQGIQVVTAG